MHSLLFMIMIDTCGLNGIFIPCICLYNSKFARLKNAYMPLSKEKEKKERRGNLHKKLCLSIVGVGKGHNKRGRNKNALLRIRKKKRKRIHVSLWTTWLEPWGEKIAKITWLFFGIVPEICSETQVPYSPMNVYIVPWAVATLMGYWLWPHTHPASLACLIHPNNNMN